MGLSSLWSSITVPRVREITSPSGKFSSLPTRPANSLGPISKPIGVVSTSIEPCSPYDASHQSPMTVSDLRKSRRTSRGFSLSSRKKSSSSLRFSKGKSWFRPDQNDANSAPEIPTLPPLYAQNPDAWYSVDPLPRPSTATTPREAAAPRWRPETASVAALPYAIAANETPSGSDGSTKRKPATVAFNRLRSKSTAIQTEGGLRSNPPTEEEPTTPPPRPISASKVARESKQRSRRVSNFSLANYKRRSSLRQPSNPDGKFDPHTSALPPLPQPLPAQPSFVSPVGGGGGGGEDENPLRAYRIDNNDDDVFATVPSPTRASSRSNLTVSKKRKPDVPNTSACGFQTSATAVPEDVRMSVHGYSERSLGFEGDGNEAVGEAFRPAVAATATAIATARPMGFNDEQLRELDCLKDLIDAMEQQRDDGRGKADGSGGCGDDNLDKQVNMEALAALEFGLAR